MSDLYAIIGVYWAALTLVSLIVVLYRKAVARWLRTRMRYRRAHPAAQRFYERSVLLGGIGIGAFSLILLYVHLVIIPSLERTLKTLRPTTVELQRQTPDGHSI